MSERIATLIISIVDFFQIQYESFKYHNRHVSTHEENGRRIFKIEINSNDLRIIALTKTESMLLYNKLSSMYHIHGNLELVNETTSLILPHWAIRRLVNLADKS